MPHREVITVCSQIHTNTLYGQNVELLNVKLAVHMVTTGLSAHSFQECCRPLTVTVALTFCEQYNTRSKLNTFSFSQKNAESRIIETYIIPHTHAEFLQNRTVSLGADIGRRHAARRNVNQISC
jgi:hypothetical protein